MPVVISLLLWEKLSGKISVSTQPMIVGYPRLGYRDTLGIPVIATISIVIRGARSTSYSVTRLFPKE